MLWIGLSQTIPSGMDVLVTHNPPRGHLDAGGGGHVALCHAAQAAGPKLHVFGHVHGGAGTERVAWRDGVGTLLVNAASCGSGGRGGGSDRKCCNPPIVAVRGAANTNWGTRGQILGTRGQTINCPRDSPRARMSPPHS